MAAQLSRRTIPQLAIMLTGRYMRSAAMTISGLPWFGEIRPDATLRISLNEQTIIPATAKHRPSGFAASDATRSSSMTESSSSSQSKHEN